MTIVIRVSNARHANNSEGKQRMAKALRKRKSSKEEQTKYQTDADSKVNFDDVGHYVMLSEEFRYLDIKRSKKFKVL
jgi:hypothetical protein